MADHMEREEQLGFLFWKQNPCLIWTCGGQHTQGKVARVFLFVHSFSLKFKPLTLDIKVVNFIIFLKVFEDLGFGYHKKKEKNCSLPSTILWPNFERQRRLKC